MSLMHVLLVNTSENTGGAAIACRRLMEALQRAGVEVRLRTAPRRRGLWCKAIERLMLLPFMRFSWRRSWSIDVNWLGTDITGTDDFEWADVVHLHWVNQGMLSLAQIEKIVRSRKKVVWTMHDVWNATGVCHLTLDCEQYKDGCQQCPCTMGVLARHTWQRKQRLYGLGQITFTTCSKWLRSQALESKLMKEQLVYAIPNPIDTRIFHPSDREAARHALGITDMEQHIVLFVAQRLDNPNKGVRYLIDAMLQLKTKGNIALAIMGSGGNEIASALGGIQTYDLGYQSDPHTIARIYAAADVFVLPSLSENLPNTIMEAMACGIPSVAFNIGGIPEMIDHQQNGYVANIGAQELAAGILYCLDTRNKASLSASCLEKVRQTYSQQAVAERFIEIYKNNELSYPSSFNTKCL